MRCVVLGALVLDLIATLPDRHVAASHHAASSRVLKYSTRTNHRLFAGALDRALRGLNFDHLLLGHLTWCCSLTTAGGWAQSDQVRVNSIPLSLLTTYLRQES